MVKRLTFENIDFELRYSLVLIRGDSSTGKTYSLNKLFEAAEFYRSIKEDNALSQVYLFNYRRTMVSEISNLKGKVILIDNYDTLCRTEPELLDIISNDIYNQYVVVGRRFSGLVFGFRNLTTVKQEDGIFKLEYEC